MAIIDPWNVPIDIKEMQYAIKGNMIISEIILRESHLMKMDPNTFQIDIKKQLMVRLLDEIMKTRSVEFTMKELHDSGNTCFRARMFAVPDDQVKILRVSSVNNIST
jgi:hypothetical protein